EDGIRDWSVTGVQTCALPILSEAEGKETAALRESFSACGTKIAAWSSKAAAMAGASREEVPSSSMSATKLAVPGLPEGSVSSPRSEERRVGKEGSVRWWSER